LKSATISAVILFTITTLGGAGAEDTKSREEGVYKIYSGGGEIGSEKYAIWTADGSAGSSSVLDFRNPANTRQKMHVETKLEMDARYVPTSYKLTSEIDGRKEAIRGSFEPQEAMFEYSSGTAQGKRGVLVGKEYTILDTNIFHHFIFLVRLYSASGRAQQQFEVVIPQESDSGILKLKEIDKEVLTVGNKKVHTNHLQADTGSLSIQLWADDSGILYKISVPDKGIEVSRKP